MSYHSFPHIPLVYIVSLLTLSYHISLLPILKKMATVNILRRPLDLIIVLIFINFLIIAITIGKIANSILLHISFCSYLDYTQTVYGSVLAQEDIDYGIWPPVAVLKVYAWWCETYDPLLAHNPSWYEEQFSVTTPLFYLREVVMRLEQERYTAIFFV